MTRKTKITLLAVLIVITMLRESGYINLSYYNSDVSSGQSNSFDETNYGGAGSLRDVPLIVKCMGYEQGEEGTADNPAVIVNIDDINEGALWIPLLKHVNFNVSVPISIDRNGHDITGTMSLNGTLAVNGFCSHRDAERMLVQHVIDNVYKAIRAHMDKYN